jgi:polysaccharide export outer membrane protein
LRKVVPLILLLCVSACAQTAKYDYSQEPDPRKQEYVIGIPDGLRITVWKNPELSGEARVRPDGTITLPLIGDIKAAGLTPQQLKNEILRLLSQFIKDENLVVTVAVTDPNSYRFTVTGNVEHPGVFDSKVFVTVAHAIALAGGFNKFASPQSLVIVRTDKNGAVRRIPIDYNRAASGLHPEENLALIAGDTVFVP